ncbi:MAG: ABC transporter permease [Rhodobiaceae bacterium]|nr:ABC transporter permease [Rhodobiaceae bacterium]MCC0048625.1 ABC transporter permease [Rhodobiaceae bacterium]
MAESHTRPKRRVGWGLQGLGGTLPAVIFLIAFFVLPLVDNTINSFENDGSAAAIDNYVRLFTDSYYIEVIARTLWVSLLSTLICIVLGYPIAYYLVRHTEGSGAFLIFLLVAPLMTSIIMRTYGWQILLARNGPISNWLLDFGLIDRPLATLRSPVSVYFGVVHILVPYMVISIASVLQSVDRRLEEAALILGASRWRAFWRVTLPLSTAGIVTGSIIVFMLCNGSFLTMLLLGNGSVVTLPLLIYQQFILVNDAGFAATMGNVLLFLALACLYLQLRTVRGRGHV